MTAPLRIGLGTVQLELHEETHGWDRGLGRRRLGRIVRDGEPVGTLWLLVRGGYDGCHEASAGTVAVRGSSPLEALYRLAERIDAVEHEDGDESPLDAARRELQAFAKLNAELAELMRTASRLDMPISEIARLAGVDRGKVQRAIRRSDGDAR